MPRLTTLCACLFAVFQAGLSWGQGLPIGRKPPESATKVKRVMVYSYVYGWQHTDGILGLEEAVARLAREKGFEFRIVKEPALLTPDFLDGFDALVWNNNYDAYRSVPDSSAKRALLEYIRDGGGWVGVHGALDNSGGWTAWSSLIGVSSNRWNQPNGSDLVIDEEARSHPELRHMVAGFPPSVRLLGELKGYDRTVRGTEGILVGATLQNPKSGQLIPNRDGIAEQALWWARMQGKGRMFMTDVGHFAREYALADNFPVKALWEHLRFAAGDYRNGCTDPASAFFDPEARVDDGSCMNGVPISVSGRTDVSGNVATFRLDGLQPSRFTLPFAPGRGLTAELLDLRGRRVWSRSLAGSGRSHRVAGQEPGVYLLRFRDGTRQTARRVLIVRQD